MIASNSGEVKSAQQIFADNERPLFWIMIAELLAYIVSAFTLLGISHLWQPKRQAEQTQGKPIEMHYRGERSYVYLPDGRKKVTQSTYSPDEVGMIVDADYEFPSEMEAAERQAKRSSALRQSRQSDGKIATVATVAYTSELKMLREHLREIALDYPMKWFRADLIEGGVLIRMFTRQKGREITIAQTRQSDKLLAAVNRPDFRERLIDELVHQGFPLTIERKDV